MRNFIILIILAFASPSMAALDRHSIGYDFENLSDTDKAEIVSLIATKNKNGQDVNISKEEVEPYLKLINSIGEGLIKLAKDLGTTANELIYTPVGIVTVSMIAYHIMGDKVLNIILGIGFFWTMFPIWLILFYKIVIPIEEYEEVIKKYWFKNETYVVKKPIRTKPAFFLGYGSNNKENRACGNVWVFTVILLFIGLITTIWVA